MEKGRGLTKRWKGHVSRRGKGGTEKYKKVDKGGIGLMKKDGSTAISTKERGCLKITALYG